MPEIFLMESENRARQVAKDLVAILSERGIEITNKQARNATARIYGHADWPAMLATVGTGRSLDDAGLDDISLADRRENQLSVLFGLGVPEGMLDVVRARLAPTGRTSADVEKVDILRTKHDIMLYHPYRYHMASDSMANEELSHAMETGKVSFSDFENGGRISLGSGTGILEEWADFTDVLPADRYRIRNPLARPFGIAIDRVIADGAILDASTFSVSDDRVFTWTELASLNTPKARYVHVGHNRFPSPWYGCGIEGCYLMPYVHEGEACMLAIPVISPECGTADIFEDGYAGPEDMFLSATRFDGFMVTATMDEPLVVEQIGSTTGDWSVLARPAIRVALAAVFEDMAHNARDSMSEKAFIEAVRAIQRARTDKVRQAALDENALNIEDVLVRIVGDVPAYMLDAGITGLNPMELDDIEPEDIEDQVNTWIRMMQEGVSSDAVIHYAKRVNSALGHYDPEDWVDLSLAIANRCMAGALLRKGDLDTCRALAMDFMLANEQYGDYLLPYLLASSVGDKENMEEAVEFGLEIHAVVEEDGEGIDHDEVAAVERSAMLWTSFAIVHAFEGDVLEAAGDLAAVFSMAPLVLSELRGERAPWRDGDIGFDVQRVLGTAWEALPNKAELLAAFDSHALSPAVR